MEKPTCLPGISLSKMLLIIKDRHFVRGCKIEKNVNHNNGCRHYMMFWTYDFVTDRFTQISSSGNSSFFMIAEMGKSVVFRHKSSQVKSETPSSQVKSSQR